ncbi:MAG: FecR domain-containing protein [Alphaproteobacteria bacterium]|nr:FecR domain-containing protein [Alphaproteobacteria bacterium]
MALATPCAAAEAAIGQIKTETGTVSVERGGAAKPLTIGDHVFEADTIVTADGTVGITFADNSMMSLGPNSRLSLDQFKFDTTTQNGIFNSSLKKGTLAVKSGQIVRQTPEAMRIRTPAALLGVRGTEFAVSADGKSQ